MAWKPLLERLDGDVKKLPLILAGPILRKVTKESVTVWLVLSEHKTASLNVYDLLQKFVASTQTDNYVTIGNHIHIYTLTVSFADNLKDDRTYYYDIDFYNEGFENHKQLSTMGLDLSYESKTNRPCFHLPQKLKHLNIIHGSCRKPHAEGRDALEALDVMMTDAASVAGLVHIWRRPHQLFLTGDQIYADDVADAMLYMIQDAANVLFDWKEDFGESLEMRVGRREENNEKIGLTSGESKSHIYTFQEYCIMYLMVWSDVLWQDDGALPTYELLFPYVDIDGELNTPYYWASHPNHRDAIKVNGEKIKVKGRCIFKNKSLSKAFEKEIKNLKIFRETLHPIRKAMANIPTYMIFDDHDVTDDWNLNWQWCKEIYSKQTGLQLLRNALSAYTLFQGMGNTPEQFENGNGKAFLDEINNLSKKTPSSSLDGYLNIRPIALNAPNSEERPRDSQSLIFHYQLSFEDFEVIVLDTRTMREYQKKYPIGNCGLISKNGFDLQLPKENSIEDKMVFVVTPSPLIETPIMEFLKKNPPSISASSGKTFWDTEAWGLNEPTFERMLSRLSRIKKPKANIRNEHFIILSGDIHHAYTATLELWADRLFEESDNNQITTHNTFIQFTSSPLKNKDHITKALHNFGYKVPFWSSIPKIPLPYNLFIGGATFAFRASQPLPEPTDIFGWNGKENLFYGTGSSWGEMLELKSSEEVVVISRNAANNLNVRELNDPEWVYQKTYLLATSEVDHIKMIDIRTPKPKKFDTVVLSHTSSDVIYKELGGEFRRYADYWGNGKEIVGVNNIGQVSIKKVGSRNYAVQSLWWHLGDEYGSPLEIHPLSTFKVNLKNDSEKPTYKWP